MCHQAGKHCIVHLWYCTCSDLFFLRVNYLDDSISGSDQVGWTSISVPNCGFRTLWSFLNGFGRCSSLSAAARNFRSLGNIRELRNGWRNVVPSSVVANRVCSSEESCDRRCPSATLSFVPVCFERWERSDIKWVFPKHQKFTVVRLR